MRDWYFRGFVDDGSERLRYIVLPQHPILIGLLTRWHVVYGPTFRLHTNIPGFAKNSRNGYRNKTQFGLLTAPIPHLLQTA